MHGIILCSLILFVVICYSNGAPVETQIAAKKGTRVVGASAVGASVAKRLQIAPYTNSSASTKSSIDTHPKPKRRRHRHKRRHKLHRHRHKLYPLKDRMKNFVGGSTAYMRSQNTKSPHPDFEMTNGEIYEHGGVPDLKRSTTPTLESITVKERISPSLESLHQLTIQDGQFIGDKISAIVKHGKDILILDNGTRFDVSHLNLNKDQPLRGDKKDENVGSSSNTKEMRRFQNLMLPNSGGPNGGPNGGPDQKLQGGKHIINFSIGPRDKKAGEDITFMAKVHLTPGEGLEQEHDGKRKNYNQLFAKIRNDIIKEYNEMFGANQGSTQVSHRPISNQGDASIPSPSASIASPSSNDENKQNSDYVTLNGRIFYNKKKHTVYISNEDNEPMAKFHCNDCTNYKKFASENDGARRPNTTNLPYDTAPFTEKNLFKNRLRKIPNYFGSRLRDEFLRKSYHDYLLSLEGMEAKFHGKYDDQDNGDVRNISAYRSLPEKHTESAIVGPVGLVNVMEKIEDKTISHPGKQDELPTKSTSKDVNSTTSLSNSTPTKYEKDNTTSMKNVTKIGNKEDSSNKERNVSISSNSSHSSNESLREKNTTHDTHDVTMANNKSNNSNDDSKEKTINDRNKTTLNQMDTKNSTGSDSKQAKFKDNEEKHGMENKSSTDSHTIDLPKAFNELEGNKTSNKNVLQASENKQDSSKDANTTPSQSGDVNPYFSNISRLEDQTISSYYDIPAYEIKLDNEQERINTYNGDIYRDYLKSLKDLRVSLADDNITGVGTFDNSYNDNKFNHVKLFQENGNTPTKDESGKANNSTNTNDGNPDHESKTPTKIHTKFGDFLLSDQNVDRSKNEVHLYTGPPLNYLSEGHTLDAEQKVQQINYLNGLKFKIDHLLHDVKEDKGAEAFDNDPFMQQKDGAGDLAGELGPMGNAGNTVMQHKVGVGDLAGDLGTMGNAGNTVIFNNLDTQTDSTDKTPLLLKPEGILSGIRNMGDPSNVNSGLNMMSDFNTGSTNAPMDQRLPPMEPPSIDDSHITDDMQRMDLGKPGDHITDDMQRMDLGKPGDHMTDDMQSMDLVKPDDHMTDDMQSMDPGKPGDLQFVNHGDGSISAVMMGIPEMK